MYTADPYADFEVWDSRCEQALDLRPICSYCEQHIQDDEAYLIDGEWICEGCISDFKRTVPDE